MISAYNDSKVTISFPQLLWLTIAQLGGAAMIYLLGIGEAGKNVWISNLIASIMGVIVIVMHYLPVSISEEKSIPKMLNKYWGKFFGGLVNLYYIFFFFILSCLIVADVFYFGKITMPETPPYIFSIFFIVPAVYAVKLGFQTVARGIEFLLPTLITIYIVLMLLVLPKLDLLRILPVMSDGIRPVLEGSISNMNFPYAQILPIVFYYKYTNFNFQGKRKYLKYTLSAVGISTILLTLRAVAVITAFDEGTMQTLTLPLFSTIRTIEVANIIERLDPLFLAVFYLTTAFKFILTYNAICEIICEYFDSDSPKDVAWPVAILIGVSMPLLIPRFDLILKTLVPYFIVSMPLFLPIPLLLYITIKFKNKKGKNKRYKQKS